MIEALDIALRGLYGLRLLRLVPYDGVGDISVYAALRGPVSYRREADFMDPIVSKLALDWGTLFYVRAVTSDDARLHDKSIVLESAGYWERCLWAKIK